MTLIEWYSPMCSELDANNCFHVVFRAEQRGLQNDNLNYNKQVQLFVCILYIYATVVLIKIVLQIHWFWTNLLVKFSIKTNKQNTTKNKFTWYLWCIIVNFIHCCHNRLQNEQRKCEQKKILVSRSDLLVINVTSAFTTNTSSWKAFWSDAVNIVSYKESLSQSNSLFSSEIILISNTCMCTVVSYV